MTREGHDTHRRQFFVFVWSYMMYFQVGRFAISHFLVHSASIDSNKIKDIKKYSHCRVQFLHVSYSTFLS